MAYINIIRWYKCGVYGRCDVGGVIYYGTECSWDDYLLILNIRWGDMMLVVPPHR